MSSSPIPHQRLPPTNTTSQTLSISPNVFRKFVENGFRFDYSEHLTETQPNAVSQHFQNETEKPTHCSTAVINNRAPLPRRPKGAPVHAAAAFGVPVPTTDTVLVHDSAQPTHAKNLIADGAWVVYIGTQYGVPYDLLHIPGVIHGLDTPNSARVIQTSTMDGIVCFGLMVTTRHFHTIDESHTNPQSDGTVVKYFDRSLHGEAREEYLIKIASMQELSDRDIRHFMGGNEWTWIFRPKRELEMYTHIDAEEVAMAVMRWWDNGFQAEVVGLDWWNVPVPGGVPRCADSVEWVPGKVWRRVGGGGWAVRDGGVVEEEEENFGGKAVGMHIPRRRGRPPGKRSAPKVSSDEKTFKP